MTTEQLQAQGAMSPMEFVEHFKTTGGKVEGMGPSLPGAP